MVRACNPTKVSLEVTVALFAAYIASVMAVSTLDDNVDPRALPVIKQGVNVGALAALLGFVSWHNKRAQCSLKTWSWVTLGVLGGNLAVRALGPWRSTRWDMMASVFGTVAVLSEMYYGLVPRQRGRTTLFALALVFVLPLLATIPRLIEGRAKPDRDTLLRAADVSQEAYAAFDGKDLQKRVVTRRVRAPGTDEWTTFIGFAGTETKDDWKTDANIKSARVPREWLRAEDPELRAHAGFVEMYAQLRDTVHAAAAKGPAPRRVVVCGHSLGGALATLAALDLATKGAAVQLYSFGAPAVGDAPFVKTFNARVPVAIRVYNPYDPVPRSLSSQFMHVKGHYAVTTLTSDLVPTTAHALSTYQKAVRRPAWLRVLGVFGPVLYIILPIVLVLVVRWYLGK